MTAFFHHRSLVTDDRMHPACPRHAAINPGPYGESVPAAVTLVPFTASWLAAVKPWFDHPEVDRRLGGREWPARELRLLEQRPGGEFRGRSVLRAHSWVGLDAVGVPVGKIGGEVYDRWCRFDGTRADAEAVSAVEPGLAMGLAYVVDPQQWRRGIGRALLLAAMAHEQVADVRVFALGIDADNEASRRCAAAAGFAPDVDVPDWEETVYYLRRRPPVSAATAP
jgi:RimJ/RimL family protein N-acetyltransferase